jgi:uncharacterized protein YlxP (DUF503 family)
VVVAVLTADFRLPQASTLKDKRAVVQSMVQRCSRRFRAAVAEVGWLDDPRRTLVAAALVSNSARHADQVLASILTFMEGNYPVELIDAGVEHR